MSAQSRIADIDAERLPRISSGAFALHHFTMARRFSQVCNIYCKGLGKNPDYLIASVSIPRRRTLFVTEYRWRHGPFSSLEAAQRLTNANLARNADVVNAVATGQQEDAFITNTFSSITGQEAYRLTRRASSPVRLRTTFGAGTYIRHSPHVPNGFIIITSYPRSD